MASLVSVVVPIYNVENVINKCATSLLKQTYKHIEFIFVNDCTPDNSMEILQKVINNYPERGSMIKIVEHEHNKGLGRARETGFTHSTGDFIIHIDSDDWCELDMIEKMISLAQEKNADMVISDYYLNFETSQVIVKNVDFKDRDDLFKKILRDEVFPSLCNKLVARECYAKVKFPDFNLGEDFYIVLQLIKNSRSVAHIELPFFHYNKENENSITTIKSEKLYEDVRVYCYAVKALLVEWGMFDTLKNDYYTGVLSRTLVINIGDNYKEKLKSIEPKAVNILNLWSLQNRSIPKKAVYSLSFVGLSNAVQKLKSVYRFLLKHN